MWNSCVHWPDFFLWRRQNTMDHMLTTEWNLKFGTKNSPVLRIHYAIYVTTKKLGPFWKIFYIYSDAYWKPAMSTLHIMFLFINVFITQSQSFKIFVYSVQIEFGLWKEICLSIIWSHWARSILTTIKMVARGCSYN